MFNIINSHKWKEQEHEDTLVQENIKYNIVLHNDDFNTFDYVIDCLINICGHNKTQAEQCTFIIHYKGKCKVKSGVLDDLYPIHYKLLDKGLSSEIA